jgi:NADPH-dependent stearoyl-CoA 9-desaturase
MSRNGWSCACSTPTAPKAESRSPEVDGFVGHGFLPDVLPGQRYGSVVGVDDDLGYGVLRVTRDQEWKPSNLLQPLRRLLLAVTFEWGIALHGLYSAQDRAQTDAEKSACTRPPLRKIARQAGRDYLLFPAFGGRRWRRDLFGNTVANLLRNLCAYVVICCGHFANGAEKFTPETLDCETKPQRHLREMLVSTTFRAGPVIAFMSGSLCCQIEHHLYPDLPSNRYAQIAQRVQAVCVKYDLPYTTGPLVRQYLLTLRTIIKLALPDRFLRATSDDAPETASEDKFRSLVKRQGERGVGNRIVRRHGLATAIRNRNNRLNQRHISARHRVAASPR